MELQQIKPEHNASFTDAVLEGARSKAAQIVEDAENARRQALSQAQAQCKKADYNLIKKQHMLESRRSEASAKQDARRELLRYREELVQEMLAEVQQQLAAFTASEKYGPWLQSGLRALLAKLPATGGEKNLYLREADMPLAPLLQQMEPGIVVQHAEEISLGGFKLAAGNVLYDETLDAALQAERQKFIQNSGLSL